MEEDVSKVPGPISSASSGGTRVAEVAVRGQVVTPKQHKAMQTLSLLMLVLALLGFCYAMVFKTTSPKSLFRHPHVQGVNVTFSAINLFVLGSLLVVFTYNLILVHNAKLFWNKRKRTVVYIALAQLIVQFINTVFFMVPNAHSIAVPCSWFQNVEFASGFVRWSCWNSLFCLIAIQAHNISPWVDSQGNLRRAEVNGASIPLLIMDGKFWVHVPKLAIWCCFEFCIIYLAAAYPDNFDFEQIEVPESGGGGPVSCAHVDYKCKSGAAYKTLTTIWIGFLILYVLLIHAYIRQIRHRLLLAPYKEYLTVHLMMLRMKNQVWYLAVLGVAMVPILWYTRWQRCNNYFVAWLGLLPFQVIATSVVFNTAFYFMPMRPGDNSIQQEWLQEFAWLERGLEAAIQKRAAHNPEKAEELSKEPMFCFESAVSPLIKLLLWSELVYYDYSDDAKSVKTEAESALPKKSSCDCLNCFGSAADESDTIVAIKPEGSSPGLDIEAAGAKLGPLVTSAKEEPAALLTDAAVGCRELLQVAMEMYDLDEFEIIHEQLLETRVLIAWSSKVIVVAFRGTAEMANVWSDAKAWRTFHPPKRGKWFLWSQPMVHSGFWETWTVNNLDKRVIARINSIVAASKVAPEDFTIYLTGHSLGGALATLAAIDLQKASKFPRLYVYTYGAPRTGNHAFAKEYEALVPHTWHVINDRDAVPRSAKFWVMYKRPGQRTLINQVGDIRVRPAVLEVCLHTTGFSIKQHYMASYLRSLWSICVAQCMESKNFPGGWEAVKALAASPSMQAYFATIGLDLIELAETPPEQVTLPSLVLKQQRISRGCCNIGVLDYFTGLFEELLPISDNTAAMLSLMSQQRTVDGAAAAAAAEEEEGLARRMSVLSLQRQLSSLGRRSAVAGPSSVMRSSVGRTSLAGSEASSVTLERPSRQGTEISTVFEGSEEK